MKNFSTLWGNIDICPCLNCLELPCHSPVEISLSSFKVWGNIQSLHHDMAYLLVCLGNTTEERQYGVSLVWVELTGLISWHSCMRVSGHMPLPKGKHLGILPQGKSERTSCGQISQLDICQLLSAGSQVVYQTGLNRHKEPIITTLLKPLRSSMSIITSKHPYLEIDIPPNRGSDTKILPINKVSIIQTTNLYNPPP